MRQLAKAGIPTTVMVAPIIPGAQRCRDRAILTRAAAAGVRQAGYVLLRLPLEVRDLFREWLIANFPGRFATSSLGPRRARRQGLRFDLRQAHDRHGPLCLDDRPPLRGRLARNGFAQTRSKLRTDFFSRHAGSASNSACCEIAAAISKAAGAPSARAASPPNLSGP